MCSRYTTIKEPFHPLGIHKITLNIQRADYYQHAILTSVPFFVTVRHSGGLGYKSKCYSFIAFFCCTVTFEFAYGACVLVCMCAAGMRMHVVAD